MAGDQEVTRLQEQVITLFKGQERLEDRQEKHEEDDKNTFTEVVKQMQEMRKDYANRLPVWATFLIAALTAAVSWSVKGGVN